MKLRIVALTFLLLSSHSSAFAQDGSDQINAYRRNPTAENFRALSDFYKMTTVAHWLGERLTELPQFSAWGRSDEFARNEVQQDQAVRPYFERLSPVEKGNAAAYALANMISSRINRAWGDGGVSDQFMAKFEAGIATLSNLAMHASDQSMLRYAICETAAKLEDKNYADPEEVKRADLHFEQSRIFLLEYFRTPLGQALSRTDCSKLNPGALTPLEQLTKALGQSGRSTTLRFFSRSENVETVRCSKRTIQAWLTPILEKMQTADKNVVSLISIVPKTKDRSADDLGVPCGIHLSVKQAGIDPLTGKDVYIGERRDHAFRPLGTTFVFSTPLEAAELY